ncbi:unnamed protein product, partial [Effrenium voratum]
AQAAARFRESARLRGSGSEGSGSEPSETMQFALLLALPSCALAIVASSGHLAIKKTLPEGNFGLPLVAGKRPGWLARRDELVVDARPQQKGGMLILQLVLMDAGGYWGKENSARPRWLRSILATNRHHARTHGHAMVLRWKRTLPLTSWQQKMCGSGKSREECIKRWERENFCWEKFPFMV